MGVVPLATGSTPSDTVGFMRIVADADDPASFIAPDLLLISGLPSPPATNRTTGQGYFFSFVLLARPGFYDPPAEVQARGPVV